MVQLFGSLQAAAAFYYGHWLLSSYEKRKTFQALHQPTANGVS
ncbi:hypothetical protein [Enterococcus gallinarum]|nr:hypothetical protein [Enterococcus gallinarum]OJG49900.1 hypothetical protein RV03_GL003010 [Enterococcus gallinarum]